MLLFYTPDIVANAQLPEQEAQHCLKVLRMQSGDKIHLTDGKGNFYEAVLVEANPKHCRVDILQTLPQPPLWKGKLEIAMAPTKNMERVEWFAEKATEIGIDKITFLNCRFSERKDIKTERINKILVSAMKQSVKARLPELQGMTAFKEWVRCDFSGQKFIAHCYPEKKELLSQVYKANQDALILIGPEGDFSEEEVALAKSQGFIPVSLGESRLRTETAALTACQIFHIVKQINGDCGSNPQ
jgi:16S rRNA (uracil1498-N3)-methyltransferase